MTTISGAAVYAPPVTNWGWDFVKLKKDINVLIATGPYEISTAIREVYNADYVPAPGGTSQQPLSEFDHFEDRADNPFPNNPAALGFHSEWTIREWADQFAGSSYDHARAVATNEDGELAVAGSFQSTAKVCQSSPTS